MDDWTVDTESRSSTGERRIKLVGSQGRVAVVVAKDNLVENIAFYRGGRIDGPAWDRPGQGMIDSVVPGLGLGEMCASAADPSKQGQPVATPYELAIAASAKLERERERVLAEFRALAASWDDPAEQVRHGDPECSGYASCVDELRETIAKLGDGA